MFFYVFQSKDGNQTTSTTFSLFRKTKQKSWGTIQKHGKHRSISFLFVFFLFFWKNIKNMVSNLNREKIIMMLWGFSKVLAKTILKNRNKIGWFILIDTLWIFFLFLKKRIYYLIWQI